MMIIYEDKYCFYQIQLWLLFSHAAMLPGALFSVAIKFYRNENSHDVKLKLYLLFLEITNDRNEHGHLCIQGY